MAYRYKFKSNKASVEAWLKDCEDFKNQISEIKAKYGIEIHINKKVNSIYFELNGISYRLSTHDEGVTNADDEHNWSGYERPEKSIRTNSKTNMIKHLIKILEEKSDNRELT